jgi:hypothetical protein
MGLFLKNGDPVRGTLEWEHLPRALSVDWPYVAALLPNGTVVVHSIETLKMVQTLEVPASLGARTMSSSMDGLYAPSGANNQNVDLVPFRLIPPKPSTLEGQEEDPSAPESGSGLTPPPSPPPKSAKRVPPTFTRTHLLLVGASGVSGLLPQTLSAQCEMLLAEHKIDEALSLVAAADRREGGTPEAGVEREMHYIRQKIALDWMAETKFEKAGEELYRGRMDPRLLIRLWPALRGDLIPDEARVLVFSGIQGQLDKLVSVEQTGASCSLSCLLDPPPLGIPWQTLLTITLSPSMYSSVLCVMRVRRSVPDPSYGRSSEELRTAPQAGRRACTSGERVEGRAVGGGKADVENVPGWDEEG